MRKLHIFLFAMSLSVYVAGQQLYDERYLVFREAVFKDTATVEATLTFLADSLSYERDELSLWHRDRSLSIDNTLSAYEISEEDTLFLRRQYPFDDPLMITEYLEGSSWNKAVEVCNISSMTVDLDADAYTLLVYTNGSWEARSVNLTGVLDPGGCYVVAHTSSGEELQEKANDLSGVINFNGDDAVALKKGGEEGIAVDVFGRVGEQPASGYWGEGDCTTRGVTLRRNCSIEEGRHRALDPFDPFEEWDCMGVDHFDDIGLHCLLTHNIANEPEHDIELYPNPCTDKLVFDHSGVERINVIDTKGNICYSTDNVYSGKINMEEMDAGVYCIQLYTTQGVIIKQVMKQ